MAKDKESTPETEPTADLLEDYEKRKKDLEERRQKENPDGRLTAYQLQAIVQVVGGDKDPQTGRVVKPGLAHQSFPEKENFMTKLIRNYRKASNELEIIRGIIPKYSEELQDEMEEYNQKRLELAKTNAGIDDPDAQEVKVAQIKDHGNYELFQVELQSLNDTYQDALDEAQKIDKRVDQIFQKPLAKPEFDMIAEQEVPASITGEKLDAIWPMITEKG